MGIRVLRLRHALLAAGFGLLPRAAGAEPVIAHYEVVAAGFTVMRVDAMLDLDGPRYLVRTRIRMSGMVGVFASGDQVTSAEGYWRGAEPVPQHYRVTGTWRGSPREVVMDWTPEAMPMVSAIQPPNAGEREDVPEALRRHTMDSLSALAKLARTVAATGGCETDAQVFDGRRRADYRSRTASQDLVQQAGFAGPALRCAFESRLLAGFRGDQDPEEARKPQPATAWLARPIPGGSPIPVRVELPSRWFGTIRVLLVGVERPATLPEQLAQQRR